MSKHSKLGILATIALVAVGGTGGCEDKSTQPPLSEPKPAAPANNAPAAAPANPHAGGVVPVSPEAANLGDGQVIAALGVSVTLPDGWKRQPPANQMRLAEATIPDASGDPAKACLVVLSSAGGSIESNISRWAGQVHDAQGQPVAGTPETKQVGGVNVTIVEMTGTYSGMNEAPKENWTLRGAIVETAQGLLFIKMMGPAESMKAALPGFNSMVDSIKKS